MRIARNRLNVNRSRTLAALAFIGAAAAITPATLAQVAGTDKPVVTGGTAGAMGQAKALLEQGKLIEAREAMLSFMRSPAAEQLGDTERSHAIALMKAIDAKVASADPLEMSLQKAELALVAGDLAEAQRQASGVSGKAGASQVYKDRAGATLATIKARQAEIAPTVPGLIEQAQQDFQAKRYAEAKASILTVLRSGVQLSSDQATTLEHMQLQIVELAAENPGVATAPTATLGEFEQPGTVRRPKSGAGNSGGSGGGDQPAGRPEPLPAVAAPDQPPPAPAPAAQPQDQTPPPPPAAQPSDQSPPPAPMPTAQPSQDDIIAAAMKAEAGRIVAEADASFDGARYPDAFNKYSLALGQYRQYLTPGEAERVQRRIDESRLRMGAASGSGSDIANTVQGTANLIRERAQAEFHTHMQQAEAALSGGRPDEASDQVAQARLSVSQARQYFNDAEYGAFEKDIAAEQAKIAANRDAIMRASAKTNEERLAAEAKKADETRVNERTRRINENIDRIRALQLEKKYDEALQVIDQTLFIDPNNPTALLLRDIIADLAIFTRFNETQRMKQHNHVIQSLNNQDAMVPPTGIMDYPLDWPAKSFERGELAAYAETAENRQVLAKISSPNNKIPLDLADNRFEDVLKFIAQVTQIGVDPDWESLATVGVDKDTPVTLKLQNKVTIQSALERVLAKVSKDQYARAGWAVNDGVVTIASEEALRKHKVLVIYNIQDLLFQVPNYRQVPQIDLNNVLQSGGQGGGGGQSPFTNANDNQNQQDDPAVRERRVRQIIDILYANIDFEGWKDNGGETGSLQELNGSLIITNTPRNHREIVGLLSKLREIRNMQINVETKFLLVNQDWFEQIGFDLDVVFNGKSNTVTTAQGQNPNTQPIDFFDFSGQSGRPRGLQRTGINIPVTPGTTQPATVTGGQPQNWSPIGAIQNSLGITSSLAEGNFATGLLAQSPALGIAGQFLDDVQVNFLIAATQADKRSVRLTAPRLTFTNGQTANIYVATQQAFISNLTPVVGDSAVGFNPQTAVLSEGVTMLVEGVISSDRRYVTLNIDSGVSRIDQIRQVPVTAVAGGQLVNSASTQSFIELPQVTVTRVRTTATVPDEGTLLLGGQRLITEVEVESGVPVLSKIPIINRFFTNRLESKEEQSLLILCKPTILIQTEEEEKAFPGVNDQLRSGLGLR